MSEVDDRIVSMKFDNAAFEQKLSDTLASLNKLTQTLQMSNATKGLEGVSAAAQQFHMGDMEGKVEGVSKKFLALATIGITAISNLTSKVMSAGLNMVKSLSLQPAMDGFHEYETKMGSIQTILANTQRAGTKLPEVTASLDELNHYADKTIYSFGDMTKNIGLFTNAGMGIKEATNDIQGFSNAAAASGTNAEGAAGAAYQLSQAMSAGTIRLMDWRSLTNVGMGNKNMQNDLITLAEGMGTLSKNGITAKEIQGGFNQSLEKGWLSSEVMSKYLTIMSGKMSDTEMATLGLTKAQVEQFKATQKTAEEAATKVRTFTQLIGTIKEAMGSSWGETFNTVLGDFNEATDLFTSINNAVGGFVQKSSDARNELLKEWKDMGGRALLIQGFKNAIESLGAVLKPIKEAFRDLFPPKTAGQLFDLTLAFAAFMEKLKPGPELVGEIRNVFRGLFSIFDIAWHVIKGVVGLFGDLFGAISGGHGYAMDFLSWLGYTLYKLDDFLVKGGALQRFFDNLGEWVRKPIAVIKELAGAIADFFKGPAEKGLDVAADRVTGRFQAMGGAIDRIQAFFERIKPGIEKAFDAIRTWFHELGQKVADALQPGDFNAAVDVVNVGLLGGIYLMFKKFTKMFDSLNLDQFFSKQLLTSLQVFTDKMKLMQTELKANILMKIAIAIGILTASIVVLSAIDSAKLTKALTAIAVSFGQLIGALALLDKVSGGFGPVKMAALSATLISLATAVAILSVAIKNLSSLDMGELAKGLAGVGVGLALMVTAIRFITADTSGLVRAGASMILIATGVRVLANAVQAFGGMPWAMMKQGLIGVGVGLGLLVAAVNLMPKGMVAQGAGLVLLATGLRILANAVEAFGDMDWDVMKQGLIGVAAALGAIVAIMRFAPTNLPVTAAGLVVLSGALLILQEAIKKMGTLDFKVMVKGIGGIAGILAVLVIAMNAMEGSLVGAAAMVVISGALLVLAHVLKEIGQLKIAQIITGIAAIAGVIGTIAGLSVGLGEVIPLMLALGAALALIGIGFAAFGIGAILVAKAFEVMGKAGVVGTKVIIESINLLLRALPGFLKSLSKSIIDNAGEILKAADMLLRVATAFLGHILDTIIKLVPKIALAIAEIITQGMMLLRTKVPEIMGTAFFLLEQFLEALLVHLPILIPAAVKVIETFSQGVSDNAVKLVNAAVDMITSFLNAIAGRAADIAGAGLNMLLQFLLGMTQNINKAIETVEFIIVTILLHVASAILRVVEAGASILIALMKGISNNITKVANTVGDVIARFLKTLGDNELKIIDAGFHLLTSLLFGIGHNIAKVADAVGDIVTHFIESLGGAVLRIMHAGAQMLIDFLYGLGKDTTAMMKAGTDLAIKILEGAADNAVGFTNKAGDILVKFLDGMAAAIRSHSGEIRRAGLNVADAILDGITGGLTDKVKLGSLGDIAAGLGKTIVGGIKSIIPFGSPSPLFIQYGKWIAEGLGIGISRDKTAENSAVRSAEEIVRTFAESLQGLGENLDIGDVNPVITPVLDLSMVEASARNLSGLLGTPTITPTVSLDAAREIATTSDQAGDGGDTPAYSGPAEVNFYQYNNSPEALSVKDIYNNTKSQIALAKEELNV